MRRFIGRVKTLQDACQARRQVWLLCMSCGHSARLDAYGLVRFLGRDLRLDEIRRRLKCQRCGRPSRAAVVVDDAVEEIGR